MCKLLIILFISYNLETVFSFTNPITLSEYYTRNVANMKEIGSSICKFSKETWAGVCYNVLKQLREDEKYKYKVFVSYKPFDDIDKVLEWKCTQQTFFFESSLEKIGDSKGLEQEMLPCFARPALVEPDEPYNEYEYYDQFMIFPASITSVYVFERISNSMDFYLVERCTKIKWMDVQIAVPSELFEFPPPYINTNIINDQNFLRSLVNIDLLRTSSDLANIINTRNILLFLSIRTTLMKIFEKHCGIYVGLPEKMKHVYKRIPAISNLVFLNPDTGKKVFKKIHLYGCPTWKTQNSLRRKPSYDWKIAAATTVHSVFILKPMDETKHNYGIYALITNLFPGYLKYII